MNDTESFEHAMAEMRKVVMDCDMERCDMYDGDCYQCQGDILDRIQRAHERELAQARDPQRLRGTKPNTFDGSIEALREFRWQHATNDDDAVPYINAVKEMHDHELEHVRKAEYARGFHDGERSMDAEHYAVALRLRGLRFDGGSHESLSKIAYAIYPCATGWTCESCDGLRDRLIDLLGGVHEPDAALPTYDVLGNERHKAVCRLREWAPDEDGTQHRGLWEAIMGEKLPTVPLKGDAELDIIMRDRLIHLLGGDTEPNSQKSPILANSDGENGGEVTITDELRKWANDNTIKDMVLTTYPEQHGVHGILEQLIAIADRIDEQFDRICQQQEAVLQQTIDEMTEENLTVKDERDYLQKQMDKQRAMLTEQRDEARAKVLKLESENAEWRRGAERDADKLESLTGAYNDAVAERDELRKKLEELEKFDPDIAMAAYGDDNDELRRLLYRAAKLLANAEQDRDANYAYWMDCKEKVVQKSVTIDELSKELEDARDALNEATGRWAKADEERCELQAKLDAIREAVDAARDDNART